MFNAIEYSADPTLYKSVDVLSEEPFMEKQFAMDAAKSMSKNGSYAAVYDPRGAQIAGFLDGKRVQFKTGVDQEEIGEFIDKVSKNAEVPLRKPVAVAGRLIEEVVELALAAGLSPGKIFEHVTDALHNQALKASTESTVFPSQLEADTGFLECAEEAADVSLFLKDFCHVVGFDLDFHETIKWNKFKAKTFRVMPSGVVYAVKPHVK